MTFAQRIQGVFFEPARTMADAAARPKPIAAILILILALTAVFSYVAAPYSAKDSAAALKDNVKIQERMGKERFDEMMARMENPKPGGLAFRSLVVSPAFAGVFLAIQALFLLIFGRMFSSEGAFLPVFSVLLHAKLIDGLLGNLVRAVLILIRKSVIQTSTSLALLAPGAEITSLTYLLLGQVDFFQLWMFGVLGFGLAAAFKIPLKKGMILSYAFWAAKAAVNIALGLLSRSMLG
jgi:Yip1 domain.